MYSEEIKSIASQWLVKHRSTTDPEVVAKILDRARELCESQGGHFCVAHCERAYIELTNEGAVKPFKGGFESIPSEGFIPQEVIDFIERSSAFELKNRYKALAQLEEIEVAAGQRQPAPPPPPAKSQQELLTEEIKHDWAHLGMDRIRKKFNNPAYKKRFDELINELPSRCTSHYDAGVEQR